MVHEPINVSKAYLLITDAQGKKITRITMKPSQGDNTIIFRPNAKAGGVYYYSLVMNDNIIQTRKMIIINSD